MPAPVAPITLTAAGLSPDRADRATFVARSIARDDFIKNTQIPQLQTAIDNVFNNATVAFNSGTTAAADAASSAINAAQAAAAATAIQWVSGTTYAVGDARWSPATNISYRRIIAGVGTTDPSADATNWAAIVLPVLAGGTGATTAAAARTALSSAKSGANSDITAMTGLIGPGLLPVGSVIHVAMNTAPTGFLKSNGALISRTTYAALFTAIGTTFGVGDGSTTFALPDFRGEFIRGWDDGRGIDSGRAFGSAQSADLMPHNHKQGPVASGLGSLTSGKSYLISSGSSMVALESDIYTGGGSGAGAQITGTTGAETRPRNIAQLVCIKF